jgi:SAM-dependent methyltransferase
MTLGDFSKQADWYRRARPTYPQAILDLLIEDARVKAGDAVADFGAGTGILTGLLVERGFRVTAIEPNQEMRNQSDVPEAQWVNGTFEESGLETSSQDWAVAAQAFHWADPKRSLKEIRRILKPGGLLTVLWNNRINEDSEILRWTEAAIEKYVPDFGEAYRDQSWPMVLESTGDFVFVSHRSVRHEIRMSQERYLDLWRSHNRLNTLAGPEKFRLLLGEIQQYLKERGISEVKLPYRCDAWSARRRD